MSTIEQLEHKNDTLTALLQQVQSSETTPYVNSANKLSFSNILQQLIKNAERNHDKYCTHRRHSEIIKKNLQQHCFLLLDPCLTSFFIKTFHRHYHVFELFKLPFILSTKLLMKAYLDLINKGDIQWQ